MRRPARPHRLFAALAAAAAPATAFALACPAMPQQASRDAEVEVRVAVRGIADAGAAELSTRTRQMTTDLLGRLPRADRVYLEQMLFASYCSALRDNGALSEAERERRVRAYTLELRAALAPAARPAPPVVARTDPRDAARADLARLPVAYTPDAFVAAAARGDARVVQLFITAGIDVDATDARGATALAHAAARDDLPMLQALLNAGARIDAPMRAGDTALLWAAQAGSAGSVRVLLLKQPPQRDVDDAFQRAVAQGWLAAAELLREHGADVAAHGPDALRRLAGRAHPRRADDVPLLQRLLALGVPVDAADDQGDTALHAAAANRRADLAQVLLDAGADVNRRGRADTGASGRATPLHKAAQTGDAQTLSLLLARGADTRPLADRGRSALLLAIHGGRESEAKLRLLLAHGADANASAPGVEPPLHAAIERPALLRLLLAHGATPDALDAQGQPALLRAADAGRIDIVRLLLDAGATADMRSANGQTALMAAARRGQADIAALLQDRGARTEFADAEGRTALDHAQALSPGASRQRLLTLLRTKGPPP